MTTTTLFVSTNTKTNKNRIKVNLNDKDQKNTKISRNVKKKRRVVCKKNKSILWEFKLPLTSNSAWGDLQRYADSEPRLVFGRLVRGSGVCPGTTRIRARA